ncbi:MAG: hypothetical protein KAJ81_05465 [Candidatus Latescibacteria bacterium]|nr:hypothetical protein [Candidatus Latescibacterota bacterium]MCK5380898.1 hypothetical protein [Candidatus Latescibacterota bacterium]
MVLLTRLGEGAEQGFVFLQMRQKFAPPSVDAPPAWFQSRYMIFRTPL